MYSVHRGTFCSLLYLILSSVALSTPSYAALVTFAYEGKVNQVVGDPVLNQFLNQTVRMEYTFDSFAIDFNPDVGVGLYQDAISSATVTVAGNTFTANPINRNISIRDNRGNPLEDRYTANLQSASGGSLAGIPVRFFNLTFIDSTQTAFSHDALPTTPPNPADFDTTRINIHFFKPGGGFGPPSRSGNLFVTENIQVVSSVPAPSAMLLMGTGLAGLIIFRQWQGRT